MFTNSACSYCEGLIGVPFRENKREERERGQRVLWIWCLRPISLYPHTLLTAKRVSTGLKPSTIMNNLPDLKHRSIGNSPFCYDTSIHYVQVSRFSSGFSCEGDVTIISSVPTGFQGL